MLVLGVADKKNVDDMRESPSAMIMELIQGKGGEVAYSDPHVPVFPRCAGAYCAGVMKLVGFDVPLWP